MKAIILEVKDGYAAALREDGYVVKTRQLAAVGETVELSEKIVQFPSQGRRIARTAVAAALALAVTGGAYTYTNVAAASYVTLDTEEASVELAVNRMGRVVGVRALDEDSSELARELAADVRRMSVEDAVDAAMTRLDGATTVVAGVTGETEKRTADLQEALQHVAGRAEREGVELVTLEISRDARREAAEHDMSAGRAAFERGGGRWREDAPTRGDGGEPSGSEAPEPGDMPARPAFEPGGAAPADGSAPANGDAPANEGAPAEGDRPGSSADDGGPVPPANGGTPAGQPAQGQRENDGEDGRPAPRDGTAPQTPDERDTQPREPDGDWTRPDPRTPEDNGATPPDGMPGGGQTEPDRGRTRQPGEGDAFDLAPQDGAQPPRGEARHPQGGMPGGPDKR